jgi:hypothetical protein
MAHTERIMYVELKSGDDHGPAWIGRVRYSKTGRTVSYRGRTLVRRQGASGNHVDETTGEEFWISGVKKDGTDRHWAGGGPVAIDSDVLDEYLEMVTPTVRAKILKNFSRSL